VRQRDGRRRGGRGGGRSVKAQKPAGPGRSQRGGTTERMGGGSKRLAGKKTRGEGCGEGPGAGGKQARGREGGARMWEQAKRGA